MSRGTAKGTEVVAGDGLKAAAAALGKGEADVTASAPGTAFLIGAVVVCETRELDYRFWGVATKKTVNRYGTAILKTALRLVGNSAATPAVLVLPAGTFWVPLPAAPNETEYEAAAFVREVVRSLGPELKKARKKGLRSVLLGVDAINNGCQVPIHIDISGPKTCVTGLARRSDGKAPEKLADESLNGTRTIVVGGKRIYVAYCGEINKTLQYGQVQSLSLGVSQSYDAVVDLAHYFRWPGAPRGDAKQNKSGLAYFLRGCANAATPQRLGAPVFVSVALVGRTPYTHPTDGAAPSYWLAVSSEHRKDPLAAPAYSRAAASNLT